MRKSSSSTRETQTIEASQEIEKNFPFSVVSELAYRESNAKRYYRPILTLHKWFARRLGSVFRAILIYASIDPQEMERKSEEVNFWDLYLEEHSFPNKCILDPFMGGGTTIIEALKLGFGKIIGGDLNPVAWFTVKKELEEVNIKALEDEFNRIATRVQSNIVTYYKTRCLSCKKIADAMYFFWIKEIICERCERVLPAFRSYIFAFDRKDKARAFIICPECNEIFLAEHKKKCTCPVCKIAFEPSSYVARR